MLTIHVENKNFKKRDFYFKLFALGAEYGRKQAKDHYAKILTGIDGFSYQESITNEWVSDFYDRVKLLLRDNGFKVTGTTYEYNNDLPLPEIDLINEGAIKEIILPIECDEFQYSGDVTIFKNKLEKLYNDSNEEIKDLRGICEEALVHSRLKKNYEVIWNPKKQGVVQIKRITPYD